MYKIILLSILALLTMQVNAQNKKSDSALFIINRNSTKVRLIKENQRIVYKIAGDNKKHHGRIVNFTDTSIYINHSWVKLSDLKMIGISPAGMIFVKAGSGIITLAGAGIICAGIVMWEKANYSDPADLIIVYITGSVLVIAGIIIDIAVSLPKFFSKSKYDLERKYRIEIAKKNHNFNI